MRTYLKDIREKQGETLEQVAAELEITRQYYQMIESGERKKNMDVDTLYRLSNHFQITLDNLIKKELEWAWHSREKDT